MDRQETLAFVGKVHVDRKYFHGKSIFLDGHRWTDIIMMDGSKIVFLVMDNVQRQNRHGNFPMLSTDKDGQDIARFSSLTN